MDSVQLSGAVIAKRLASCNQPARGRAVRLLARWLPQQSSAADPLSDGDLIKIWKGLFYCVWHADKLPYQLDLINRLASLLETIDPDFSVRYFEAFIITIRREWSGIDLLRLDKFYLLIRKFIHRLFALLKNNDWDVDLLNRLMSIMGEKSLLATDKFQACGVNYHFAEVFLDEIQGFLPIRKETLDLLLKPFISTLERSIDRVLVNKIKANVFERLAENGANYLNGDRSEEAEKLGKYALVLGLSEKFFKPASDEGTVQGSRKVLFGLHERFLKLEKDFEKSGLEVLIEHSSNGNGVEKAESLVPKAVIEESEVRPLKKRKKEKKSSDAAEKTTALAKKKANVSLDSGMDGYGQIDDVANGDNGAESNSAETESETKKKKKKKKKKKGSPDSAIDSNGDISEVAVKVSANGDVKGNDDLLNWDETVISNLQKQFERVAAEAGMTPVNTAATKKRRRAKSADKPTTASICEKSTAGKSGEKSLKKVRFSMKNNLVWKPQTPLPPQSLRLPPSATPRGSALKKGVPPGPIKETPPTGKKNQKIKGKGGSTKKGRKSLKSISPAAKRLRKLHSLSA